MLVWSFLFCKVLDRGFVRVQGTRLFQVSWLSFIGYTKQVSGDFLAGFRSRVFQEQVFGGCTVSFQGKVCAE